MSDLFGCVPPEAFKIFTSRHALAAEAALLRLCATHFGEMALENPERDQVKNSIAAAIEGMPTPPAAVGEPDGDEPEAASSDYLYLKMREGGWLVEESDRWLIRVTMPEGYRRLMTVRLLESADRNTTADARPVGRGRCAQGSLARRAAGLA
jgi:hypothetical protein